MKSGQSQCNLGLRHRQSIRESILPACVASLPDDSGGVIVRTVGEDVTPETIERELTTLIEQRGKPGLIVSDNGTEFTSNAMLAWTQDNQIAWHFIQPGKPMQNGFCESFADVQ